MLPTACLQVYGSTVLQQVRHKCLGVMLKALTYTPAPILRELLLHLGVSSFLAGLLPSKDTAVAAAAMHMAEILMAKLPDIFKTHFLKEGVVHAMEQMAAKAPPPPPPAPASAARGKAATAATSRGQDAGRRLVPSGPAAASATPAAASKAQAEKDGGGKGSSLVGRLTRSAIKKTADDKAQGKDTKEPAKRGAASKDKASATPAAPAAAKNTKTAAASAAAAGGGASSIPPPPAAPVSTAPAALRTALSLRARRFRDAHFAAKNGSDGGGVSALETDGLRLLKKICAKIHSQPDANLPALCDAMASADISVFELLNSGAVQRLNEYLQGGDLSKLKAAQRETTLLRRLQSFAKVAFPPGSGAQTAVLPLVRKLQAALSTVETLPVMCSQVASSSSGYGSLGGASRSFGASRSSLSSSMGASSLSRCGGWREWWFERRCNCHDCTLSNFGWLRLLV